MGLAGVLIESSFPGALELLPDEYCLEMHFRKYIKTTESGTPLHRVVTTHYKVSTFPLDLTFAAKAGRTYRLNGDIDAAGTGWDAWVEDVTDEERPVIVGRVASADHAGDALAQAESDDNGPDEIALKMPDGSQRVVPAPPPE